MPNSFLQFLLSLIRVLEARPEFNRHRQTEFILYGDESRTRAVGAFISYS